MLHASLVSTLEHITQFKPSHRYQGADLRPSIVTNLTSSHEHSILGPMIPPLTQRT